MPYGAMIKTGLLVSAIVLVLIAIFGPGIRSWYRSARDKMRAATEKRRASRSSSKRPDVSLEGSLMSGLTKR